MATVAISTLFETRIALETRVTPDGRLLVESLSAQPTSLFWRLTHCSAVQTEAPGQINRHRQSAHYLAFSDWLRLKLDQQLADIETFIVEQGRAEGEMLLDWLRSGGHVALIPTEAPPAERALFQSDLKIVLELARN